MFVRVLVVTLLALWIWHPSLNSNSVKVWLRSEGAEGLLRGLIAAGFVILIWKPLLNSQEHLVTFSQSGNVHPFKLVTTDFLFFSGVVILEAVLSGVTARRSPRALIKLGLLEFLFPWPFFLFCVTALAPPANDYKTWEQMAWASPVILVNLLIAIQILMGNKWRNRNAPPLVRS